MKNLLNFVGGTLKCYHEDKVFGESFDAYFINQLVNFGIIKGVNTHFRSSLCDILGLP